MKRVKKENKDGSEELAGDESQEDQEAQDRAQIKGGKGAGIKMTKGGRVNIGL